MAISAAGNSHFIGTPPIDTDKFSKLFEASAKNAVTFISETVHVNVGRALN